MRKSKLFVLSILTFALLAYFNPNFHVNLRVNHNRNISINSEDNESWAKIIHENNIEYSELKVVNDNIYVVGYLNGEGLYVTKYNNSGVKLWAYTWNIIVWHFDFTIDSDNYLYIAGTSFTDSPDSLFLIKIDATGNLVWSKVIKSDTSCFIVSLKADLNNYLYISGYNHTGNKSILLKLNSSGVLLWNRGLSMGLPDIIEMHIDSGNNVILYIGTDYSSQYLIKYNSSGSTIWQKEWGGSHMTGKSKVTLNNDILLSNIPFFQNNHTVDAWILKINGSGTTINKTKIGNYPLYWGELWYYDDFNNIYLIGIAFYDGVFLYKINSNLTLAWNCSLNYFSTSEYRLVKIKCDSQQGITIVSGTDNYSPNSKILLLKLNSSGTIINNFYWGGPNRDRIEQVFIDDQDNLYFLGISESVNPWNVHRDYTVLVKNPKANGFPPELNYGFGKNDVLVFTIMSFVSLISLAIVLSIIMPELKIFKRDKRN
ncbi:MAG: PQQ-like beta-propeller repeat protein [Candidatus Lokiarchaeota archaeon]|nr:PQQ-like beta-propeller repeat protein [Candidatus Lokiarchaeota archaeon]